VQLLAAFALLYVLEGVLFGIPGTVLMTPPRRGFFRARRCNGPALLPLRPGRIAVLAAPLPFRVGSAGVVSDVVLRRFGTRNHGEAVSRALGFDELQDVSAKRSVLRVGGRAFARAASAEHAEAGAARLAALGRTMSANRVAEIDAWERQACDVAALRTRVDAARSAVRWLGAVCDAYVAALFLLLPVAIATLDETTALLASLPVLATLHGVALGLAWRAHRALRLEARSERFETLLAAALFPPHLLRLPQRIFLAGIGAPRPAVAAAALLTGDARLAFLRREIARREREAQCADANDEVARALCERDCAAVLAIALQAGVEEADLRRPPIRGDRHSAAYCPACLAEYRAGFDTCADCRVRLIGYRS
jgi:hypothetical protein